MGPRYTFALLKYSFKAKLQISLWIQMRSDCNCVEYSLAHLTIKIEVSRAGALFSLVIGNVQFDYVLFVASGGV